MPRTHNGRLANGKGFDSDLASHRAKTGLEKPFNLPSGLFAVPSVYSPEIRVFVPLEEGKNGGTNRGTPRKADLYVADSKEWLGIIYAAIVLLESVI